MDGHPVSALPSVRARLLAYLAIVAGGACGGLIGYAYMKLACKVHNDQSLAARAAGKTASALQNCSSRSGIGALVGASIASAGLAIVAVVVLRALGEWRSIKAGKDRELLLGASPVIYKRDT